VSNSTKKKEIAKGKKVAKILDNILSLKSLQTMDLEKLM
jgi:hypothetical protein